MCDVNTKKWNMNKGTVGVRGFTLIELMVSMVMSLIILAGIVSVFISDSRTHLTVVSKAELLGDVGLASSIIKSELRQSQNVCWLPVSKILVYQPLDSTTVISAGTCTVPAGATSQNGAFKLIAAGAGGCSTSSTPCICWDQPNKGGGCQEMLRNILPLTGLAVSQGALNKVWSVTLTGTYMNQSHNLTSAKSIFKVWARN